MLIKLDEMKRYAIILLFSVVFNPANAQHKVIKGDTAFWLNEYHSLYRTLQLIDFDTIKSDFAFRFKNYGQVVEIWKAGNRLHGVLTNYSFHTLGKRKDTLFNKIKLDSAETLQVYKLVQKTGILGLPPDKEIQNWDTFGTDGITYIIEHANQNIWWFKTYWSPRNRDSVPEAMIVVNLIDGISHILQLKEKYKEFERELPLNGCYQDESVFMHCYIGNTLDIGFIGSVRFPFGFSISYAVSHVKNKRVNFGIGAGYMFDAKGNYYLSLTGSKSKLFFHHKKMEDYLSFRYKRRKIGFSGTSTVFQDYVFGYGLSFQTLSILPGIQFETGESALTGGFLGFSKWFSNPTLTFFGSTSIFYGKIDYNFGISHSFGYFDSSLLNHLGIGLYFEKYSNYRDIVLFLDFYF